MYIDYNIRFCATNMFDDLIIQVMLQFLLCRMSIIMYQATVSVPIHVGVFFCLFI